MTRLSAILIGNKSLTQQCGAAWLSRGHALDAVVTRQAEVRAWAEAAGIRVEAPGKDLAARLAGVSVDWVLSVANLSLVPDTVLALARQGGVNFHDGPLPAHAGLNAPVWALLAGDAQHGITWHLITQGVDEGDILESRSFDISAQDTALTLNTRCYEAAIDSFPAVMSQLETGLRPVPQDFSRRTVHARADRPAAFGRIDFSQSAQAVARLVRALDHGRYWNPLTTAKIEGAGGVLNVGTAEPCDGDGEAGTVLAATPEGLVVACGTGAVRLNRLTCQIKGLPVCPSTIADQRLADLPAARAQQLSDALTAIAPHDPRLRQALARLQPVTVAAAQTSQPDWMVLPLTLPDDDLGLAAMAMARITGQPVAGFALATKASLPGYTSGWLPLSVETGTSRGAAAAAFDRVADMARDVAGWPLDLMTRDTALSALPMPQVGLSLAGPVAGTAITLGPKALHVDLARLSRAEAEALARRLGHVAAAIAGLDADHPLTRAPALHPDEMQTVLHAHNQTLAPRHDLCVHQAFEAQVARTPDAPAVCFELSP